MVIDPKIPNDEEENPDYMSVNDIYQIHLGAVREILDKEDITPTQLFRTAARHLFQAAVYFTYYQQRTLPMEKALAEAARIPSYFGASLRSAMDGFTLMERIVEEEKKGEWVGLEMEDEKKKEH